MDHGDSTFLSATTLAIIITTLAIAVASVVSVITRCATAGALRPARGRPGRCWDGSTQRVCSGSRRSAGGPSVVCSLTDNDILYS